MEKRIIEIPYPTSSEVKYYLSKWDENEVEFVQDNALNKLFRETYPNNNSIEEILIKAASLNHFYSTNIFWIYPVAKHILELNIDNRLESGDVTLVNDLANVTVNDKTINFYSFASKYCSHHRPLDFPIYDDYVRIVLNYFKRKDEFYKFTNDDLKNYPKFKEVLLRFRDYYKLQEFNLKELDKYLWQIGKKYFPKKY